MDSFVRRLLLVVLALLLLWLTFEARQILLLAVGGLVVGVLLGGSSRRLTRHLSWPPGQWRYLFSLGAITSGALALLALAGYFVGPRIAGDLWQLQEKIPEGIEALKRFPPVAAYLENNGQSGLSEEQMSSVTDALSSAARSILSITIYSITSAILVLFVGIFAAAQPRLYQDAVASCFPPGLRDDARSTVRACVEALWSWLKGQSLAMLLVGTLSTAGLWLIDVRYALTLGILAGIFQFVPYVGPIASAVPALLVAATMSPETILWVAILYLGIQFAEGNFITPIVMRKEANLPPLATLLATVAFAAVFGVPGAIIATPLAVLLMVLKREVYERRILGTDPEPTTA